MAYFWTVLFNFFLKSIKFLPILEKNANLTSEL